MVKKAVCLISGGIDSTVAVYIAKKKGYKLYCLSFDYGQRHKKELNSARKIAESVNAVEHVIVKLDLSQFGGSSLTDKSKKIPTKSRIEDIGKTIPSTYVPARNTVFLSIAMAYAETIDAETIFIGAIATDYSGYPDCRPEYIEAFQKMADLATKKGVEGGSIKINAPLLYMSKAEIIKKGIELGVPFDKTWSCYKGDVKACGRCDSCLFRLKGFKDAGFSDPIKYK